MIISNNKKFIFVHIYKTGGTSVSSALVKYARFRERIASEFYLSKKIVSTINDKLELADQGNKWVNGLHKHAKAIEVRKHLGESKYRLYYKFTFVRNPWDWQVSLYHYIKKDKYHKDNAIANTLSFYDFLKREIENFAPCQLDFLIDSKGKVIVDKVGKFESLQQDFCGILNHLNLKPIKLENLNRSNRSKNYRKYFTPKTAMLVNDYFKRDIEYFDYSF